MEPTSPEEIGQTVMSSWARATVAEFRDGSTMPMARVPWSPGSFEASYMALYRACQSPANRRISVKRANGTIWLVRDKRKKGAEDGR